MTQTKPLQSHFWLDIVIRNSSVLETWGSMVVLASMKESQRQVHRSRKTPLWPQSSDSSPRKKNLQNLFCRKCGLRGVQNSLLQSDFPHHLAGEQSSEQFLKIKEIESQLPDSAICSSQMNTFCGNSVNLCAEKLQFPLLYSIFQL